MRLWWTKSALTMALVRSMAMLLEYVLFAKIVAIVTAVVLRNVYASPTMENAIVRTRSRVSAISTMGTA